MLPISTFRSYAVVSPLVLAALMPVTTGGSGCPEPEEGPPPAISIDAPAEGQVIDNASLLLEGLASDDVGVEQLSWQLDGAPAVRIDGSGPSVSFSEPVTVTHNGDHTLEVLAVDSEGLESRASVGFTTVEPNDSFAEAFAVQVPYEGPDLRLEEGDEDWFLFEVEEAGPLSIGLTLPDGGWPSGLEITLADESGYSIDWAYDSAMMVKLEEGTYGVRVASWWEMQCDYRLVIEALSEDHHEPNNTFGEATRIELPFEESGLSLVAWDTDLFTFTLTGPQVVTAAVESGSEGWMDAVAVLYDAAGQQIAYNDDGGGMDPVLGASLGAGTYFLEVRANSIDGMGSYGLKVISEEPSDDALEENDSRAQATAVSLPFTGVDLVQLYNDVDWYTFSIETPSYVRVDVSSPENMDGLSLTLSDNDENVLEQSWWSNDDAELSRLLEPGDYFVQVASGSWELCRTEYGLSIAVDPDVHDDALEPNDELSQASAVTLDFEGDLMFFEGEEDWFTFTLMEDRVVTIDLDAQVLGESLEAYLSLYNNEGEPIAYSYSGWDSADPRLVVSLNAGSYYLALGGYLNGEDFAPYELRIIAEPLPADDALEPNDGFSTATVVTLPYDSPELQLLIGDEDWFRFTLDRTATLHVNIDARSLGSELVPSLSLYNDGGSVVAYGYDGDAGDPYLQQQLTAGTYYLKVFADVALVASDFYYLSIVAR